MKNVTHVASSLHAAPLSLLPRRRRVLLLVAAVLPILLSAQNTALAGSATWKSSPATSDWNRAGNWTPRTVPNGPSDIATFASSNATGIFLSAGTEVNGIMFNAGASAYTINSVDGFFLTLSGTGIVNNSGIAQHFVTDIGSSSAGGIIFTQSAAAGSSTTFTNNANPFISSPGFIIFADNATAANGTFINNGSAVANLSGGFIQFGNSSSAANGTFISNGGLVENAGSGQILFIDSATANNATFTNNGGAVNNQGNTSGGGTFFQSNATAANGTFTNNGGTVSDGTGGLTYFGDTSDAANATLIANSGSSGGAGGTIRFEFNPTGGTSRIEVFGNGTFDVSAAGAVIVGSIEGDGIVLLGPAQNLTVGSNDLSTVFSGVIQNSGSLSKIGIGTLTLSKASTYTGVTTVSKGTLLVTNRTGSATGTGAVQVKTGTLGGTGKITGTVAVGTGTSSGAILLPGKSATKPGTLTINSALTFNSFSTYKCVLNRSTPIAGEVTALGVTINSGATFTFVDTGTGTLTVGTVFTVINNTSASPITGTFSNLANGSVFPSNGNNFQASYTGGTGNDLTLTVVP